MIKKIFHTADWHLRCYKRHDEFLESIRLLVRAIKNYNLSFDEGIICVTGDLFHQKDEISNEAILLMVKTLKTLLKYHRVFIIIGNHDISDNRDKIDHITPIVTAIDSENLYFSRKSEIRKILGVNFVHYCFLDNFAIPINFKRNSEEIYIGLFHDIIQNAKMPLNQILKDDKKSKLDLFEGCDVVLMGDIHYPQIIANDKIEAYYCGSLYQQNLGETVNKHGFGVYDILTKKYQFIELQNSYGYYILNIKNVDDIKNNLETIKNLN